MTYERIGQAAHEWIGIGMFVLFVLPHILNRKWCKALLKEKYTLLRALQTALVAAVLFCMLGSMVSGMMLSRYAFAFLQVNAGHSFARMLHMLSAYWGFVFMGLHLGFHWGMMMGIAKKLFKKLSVIRKWILRAAAIVIAGYGISVIRNVLKATKKLAEQPNDPDARDVVLYGASIATSGRLGIGKTENYSYDIYEVEFIPEVLFGSSYRKSLTTLFPRFLKAMAAYHEADIRAYFKDAFGYEGNVAESADKTVACLQNSVLICTLTAL